jgi:hypothetical protein
VIDIQSSPEFALLAGGNPDATSGIRITGYSVMQFEFAAPPPGDFNQDGAVDSADYVVWRKGFGTDFTQDDYDVWRAHFGETAGSGVVDPLSQAPASATPLSATVPESTSVFAGWALMSLFPRRSNKPARGLRFL